MIKRFLKSDLGKGTLILLVTINIFNLLNFIFQFSMGRLLGPADFGTLAVLMSLVYVYNVPMEAIQSLVSRYTSEVKEEGKVHYILSKFTGKGIYWGSWIFLGLILVAFGVSWFLKISFVLVLITNLLIFSSLFMAITRGTLQGRKRFGKLGMTFVVEGILKLGIAIVLVYFGLKVFGSISGVVIGAFVTLILSYYFVKDILKEKREKIEFKDKYSRLLLHFMVMFVIWISFSMDIFLAKRFFSPELAGNYAVLSMLGKIIFMGTFAISKAMFPLTSEKSRIRKESNKLFKKSLFLIMGICLIGILIYFLIPGLIIGTLYGEDYVSMAPYLVYSAIASTFLALTNLVLVYGLSLDKVWKPWMLVIFLVIQVCLLVTFSSNVFEYVLAFMISNIVMFIGSLFFLKAG